MTDTKKQLKDMVLEVVNNLENPGQLDPLEYGLEAGEEVTSYDYINYQLDIEYKVDSQLHYLGGEVLVTFGGPNIWIDTRHNQVHGAWGGDRVQFGYDDNMALDDCLSQLYDAASS